MQLKWRDTNFRGLGDQLDFSILKKDGFETGLLSLDPAIKVKWTRCALRKKSAVSVTHEAESNFMNIGQILARPIQQLLISRDKGDVLSGRDAVRCSTSAVHLSRYILGCIV